MHSVQCYTVFQCRNSFESYAVDKITKEFKRLLYRIMLLKRSLCIDIVFENGQGNPGSNPERHCLHFSHSVNTIKKGMNPTILPPAFFFFIIQRVKVRAIPCPHQPPTRGDNTVSVAKAVLPLLALPSSFCHRTGY